MRRNKFVAALAILLLLQSVSTPLCLAQQAPDASAVPTPPAPTPINLDLTSTDRTLTSALAAKSPVNILVDGTQRQVDGSTLLTPAERLAVYQVSSTGNQQINLGAGGQAVGGSFTMGSHFSNYVSGMVIPNGVTATRDAGVAGALNLTGNLTNAGNILAYSTNNAVSTATFNAANITNQTTGIISTVLPSTLAANLPSNIVSNLNLSLSAINNIVNSGIISSAGNLNVTAGGTITNALPTSVTGAVPVMSAINNVNLQSAIGNIINSGVMAAATGNLNIQSLANSLNINNIAGQLQALNGSINIGDSSVLAKITTEIVGGTANAKALNIFSGDGVLRLNMQDVLGSVNVNAGEAHLMVHGNNALQIGSMNLTGDPTIFNGGGSILINGPLAFAGQDLAIIASGDITAEQDTFINTSGSARGGHVTIAAGANIGSTASSANRPSGAQDPPGGIYTHYDPTNPEFWSLQNPNGSITVYGASSTGGSINLAQMTAIDASSSQDAGDVTLVAFGGSIIGPAQISAAGGTRNGNVLALAPNGIQLGAVNTGSTPDQQGFVTILSMSPSTQKVNTVTSQQGGFTTITKYWTDTVVFQNGTSVPQSFGNIAFPGAFTNYHRSPQNNQVFNNLTAGQISTGNISAGGGINIRTLADVSTGALSTAGSGSNGIVALGVDAKNVSTGTVSLGAGTDFSVVARSDSSLGVGNGEPGIGHISLPTNGTKVSLWIANKNGVELGQDLSSPTVTRITLDGGDGDVGINGNSVDAPGGNLGIFAEGRLKLGSGSRITTDSANNGGNVAIVAGKIDGSGLISASATAQGFGGNVDIIGENSESIEVTGSGGITIKANGAGFGSGGEVYLDGPALLIGGSNHVDVSADGGTTGSGGLITVDSTFTSFPSTVNVGNQNGEISLHADGGTQSGDGGQVYVNADYDVTVKSDAISASVKGSEGSGGQIGVFAANSGTGNIMLVGDLHADGKGSGNGGGVYLSASRIGLQSDRVTEISANGSGDGDGGYVDVETFDSGADLKVDGQNGGLRITANGGSAGSASGSGGEIRIEAGGNLTVSGNDLSADALGNEGNGGSVSLVAGLISDGFVCCPFERRINVREDRALLLSDPIRVSGKGSGDGGTITIAAGNIAFPDDFEISANSGNVGGNGGTIEFLNVVNMSGTDLLLSATGTNNGGTINVDPHRRDINGNWVITTEAVNGKGGDINLTDADLNLAQQAQLIVRTRSANGSAGNITLKADEVTMPNNIVLDARSSKGDGGNITIELGTLHGTGTTLSALADSSAEAQKGGTIELTLKNELDDARINLISNGVEADGGDIFITLGSAEGPKRIFVFSDPTISGSAIMASAQSKENATAGNIEVNATNADLVFLENGLNVSAFSLGGQAAANGGTIVVNADGAIQLGRPADELHDPRSALPVMDASGAGVGENGSISLSYRSNSPMLIFGEIRTVHLRGREDGSIIIRNEDHDSALDIHFESGRISAGNGLIEIHQLGSTESKPSVSITGIGHISGRLDIDSPDDIDITLTPTKYDLSTFDGAMIVAEVLSAGSDANVTVHPANVTDSVFVLAADGFISGKNISITAGSIKLGDGTDARIEADNKLTLSTFSTSSGDIFLNADTSFDTAEISTHQFGKIVQGEDAGAALHGQRLSLITKDGSAGSFENPVITRVCPVVPVVAPAVHP